MKREELSISIRNGLKVPLGVSLPPPAGRYRPVIQSIAVNRYSHPLRACPWVNETPKFVTVPCQVAHPLTFCQVPRPHAAVSG